MTTTTDSAYKWPTLMPGETTDLKLYGEEVRQIQEGTYEVDLSRRLGRPGNPWRGGVLELETHPALKLFRTPGTPSKYWDVRTHPLVAGLIRKLRAAVCASKWRVDLGELPIWHQGDPAAEAAQTRQHDYIQRVFASWTARGCEGWDAYLRSALETTLVEGYSFAEIVAPVGHIDGRPVLWPLPPEWRAPWSIRYVITQDEQIVGVVASFYQSQDINGQTGDLEVVIPGEKLMWHITGRVGGNLGRSWLRDIYNTILGDRSGNLVEASATEINGGGELWIEEGEHPIGVKDRAQLEKHLKNRKALHGPGGILPKGCKLHQVKGDVPDLTPQVQRRWQAMAMSFGQDDRLMALTSDNGSRAARETASDDAGGIVDDVIKEIVAEPLHALWHTLIKASFPADAEAGLIFVPELSWHDPPERDAADVVPLLAQAVAAGLVTWTPADESKVRDLLDWHTGDVATQGSGEPEPEPGRYDHIDLIPPQAVRAAAAAAIEQNNRLPVDERIRGTALTRAHKLMRGEPISQVDLQRLAAAISLANSDLEYALAGGDAAREWTASVLEQMGLADAPTPEETPAPEGAP